MHTLVSLLNRNKILQQQINALKIEQRAQYLSANKPTSRATSRNKVAH